MSSSLSLSSSRSSWPWWLVIATAASTGCAVGMALGSAWTLAWQRHQQRRSAAGAATTSSSSSSTTVWAGTQFTGDASDPNDPEWFRTHARELVDWIADYRHALQHEAFCSAADRQEARLPVRSSATPGWLVRALPEHAPEHPESFDTIMNDVNRLIVPGVTHWSSPHFYAYFQTGFSFPSMLGDMLSNAFSTIGFSWISSPAGAEIETVVMDWLAALFHLPREFYMRSGEGGGVIAQTAGEAVLIAMLAARNKFIEANEKSNRFSASELLAHLVVYTSDQTHVIAVRAAKIIGIAPNNVRAVPTRRDRLFAMDPADLDVAMQADNAAGLVPFFACLTVGTTSTTAVDPVAPLSAVARQHGAWVHVDAAYGGAYAALPEFAPLFNHFRGIHSVNINAHKGLFTSFDCALLFFTDRLHVLNGLRLPRDTPYLRNEATDSGLVLDYKDLGVSFGRRMRALKLWFMLRTFGVDGVRRRLTASLELAERFAQHVRNDARFTLFQERTFGLVVFHLSSLVCGTRDEANAMGKELVEACCRSGEIFFSSTVVDQVFLLRLAVSGAVQTTATIDRDWAIIQRHLDATLEQRAKKAC